MALTAIILKEEGQTFDIKLMSGLKAKVPKVEGLQVGDSCLVMYDFTKKQVCGVIPITAEEQEFLEDFSGKEVLEDTEETLLLEISKDEIFEFSRALEPGFEGSVVDFSWCYPYNHFF